MYDEGAFFMGRDEGHLNKCAFDPAKHARRVEKLNDCHQSTCRFVALVNDFAFHNHEVVILDGSNPLSQELAGICAWKLHEPLRPG